MDILLCQACGCILRGKTKYCTGCGTFVSRHSPTLISAGARGAAPLTVTVAPDPIVVEKAVNRRHLEKYAGGNGGNGNGGYPAGGQLLTAPGPAQPALAPDPAPETVSTEPTPTSLLGSVLKGVSRSRSPYGGGSDASSLVSFEESTPLPQEPAPQAAGLPASTPQPAFAASSEPATATPLDYSTGSLSAILPSNYSTGYTSSETTITSDQPAYSSKVAPTQEFPAPDSSAVEATPPPAAPQQSPPEIESGPLIPPPALSPTPAYAAASTGPVFSARVPIPFLPRPSTSFFRNYGPSEEQAPAPEAPPSAQQATPAGAGVAPASDPFAPQAPAGQANPIQSSFDPFTPSQAAPPPPYNDPLFSTPAYPASPALPDPLFSPAPCPATAQAAQINDPLFGPAPGQAGAAQNDPLFGPAPSSFAPGQTMPGTLPPDPRESSMFGTNSSPPAFPFGDSPASQQPASDPYAILPPIYPADKTAPAAGATTPAAANNPVAAANPAAAIDAGAAANPAAASNPAAAAPAGSAPGQATSGFDFFNAPATPAQAVPGSAERQATPQAQALPLPQTAPLDLFQGQVIAHPPGSPGPQPQAHKQQPAAGIFDPAPVKADSAGQTSGLDFFNAGGPPAAAQAASVFDAGGAPPPAAVSSDGPVVTGQPTTGADFFGSGDTVATGTSVARGREGAGETPAPPGGTAGTDGEQTSGKPGSASSSLRDAAARQASAPQGPAKGGLDAVLEFFKDLDGEWPFLGKMMPRKQVLICWAVLGLIGIQVLFAVLGMAGKGISGAVAGLQKGAADQATSQFPSLAGTWELAFQAATEQKVHPGQFQLVQQGSTIQGQGQDEYGSFVMRGMFTPPKLQVNKQYVRDGQAVSKPIVYVADVSFPKGDAPIMDGIFIAQIKKGVFTSLHYEELRGKWQAQQVMDGYGRKLAMGGTQPGVGDGQAPNANPGAQPGIPDTSQQTDTSAAVGVDLPSLFMKIAIGLLFLGMLLVIASLKLFGPAGLINIWSKKEYIPSQFKSQHKKMLKQLGKPLKPGGLPLGEREDWNVMKVGEPKELHLPPEERDQNPHLLIMGSGAKGKTRLAANMITNDILSGDRAVVVIDSDGHLVELILRWLASNPKGKDLARRVLVVDPTNKDGCAAYNPLEPPEDGDYQAAASAVVYGFKAIYTEPPGSQTQWNQQTANILRNCALLLMANGRTLTDLPVLLVDNDFRDVMLEKIEKRKNERVEFITLLETWGNYKKLARTDQWIQWTEPILNRVSPMLGDPRIRPILTPTHGDLSLQQIIAEHQVLLVKIPQGQLDQNASLLGSLLVTGLKQASLSISQRSTKKHFTALYLDEFDNFIEKETFDALTSETRKFQIGFTATLKTVQNLPEDFRNQLILNVGTICAFSLAKKDADLLGPQMFRVDGRKVKHQTIQNIFNKVNTSPQFELISDEEKLNIDRLVGLEQRTYFCYRVGSIAGVFHMKAHEFKDVPDKDVDWSLIDQIYGNKKTVMDTNRATAP